MNLFIGVHVVAICAWGLPFNSGLLQPLRQAFGPYLAWVGLWQGWALFSPNPSSRNPALRAEVRFRDGSRVAWTPPLSFSGPFGDARRERFRKWAHDRIPQDSHAALWPETALYVARLYGNPANPPARVDLWRSWQEVPPMDLHRSPLEVQTPARSLGPWEDHHFYGGIVLPAGP
ncbi:MAG TPA: hypothetical protein VFU47_00430 [Armatimonadota bacterium]|nr:hypothetical protein [Armatimonadota bacterium]